MKEKALAEVLAKLERNRPELERIMNQKPIIDTGRKPKILYRIPPDMDFTTKDGNTEYEVVGYFDSGGKESVTEQMLRILGYRQ